MGENTPEAIEIQCPGCESRFRLKPKKGRLPSGDIPCPKCEEEIPVVDGDVVNEKGSSSKDRKDDNGERSPSAPGFAVTSPAPTKKASSRGVSEQSPDDTDSVDDSDDPQSESDDPIADLERMAEDLPANSTMAGLPGVGDSNPFEKSRTHDKTAQVDPSVLQQVASEAEDDPDSEVDDQDAGADDEDSDAWSLDDQPDTSPRLVSEQTVEQLADESSSAATVSENLPEETRPPGLRETAENDSVASSSSSGTRHGRPAIRDKNKGDEDSGPKSPQSSPLGRIDTKKKKVSRSEDQSTSDDSDSSSDKSSALKRLKKLKKKKQAQSGDGDDDSATDDDSKSLSQLFKKVRHKRGADSGTLKQKLAGTTDGDDEGDSSLDDPPEDAGLPIAEEVDISEGELADIVDQSAESDSPEEGEVDETTGTDDDDQRPPSTAPPQQESPDGEHSDLFDDVDSPPPQTSSSGDIGSVSKKPGEKTTQSMLARLQKRRSDDADEMGAAGEKRGSGYIRLPTAEIQDVLGQGDFRLKIEGVVYEPVDKRGLIKLIKGGVLMGAEELAEADGDWMPVSEHPVFGELRRKMASEAHEVLSRLGLDQQKNAGGDKDDDVPLPASTQNDPRDESGPSSVDLPEPPTTKEMDTNEQQELRKGLTERQYAIDADEADEADEADPAAEDAGHDDAPPVDESAPSTADTPQESQSPADSPMNAGPEIPAVDADETTDATSPPTDLPSGFDDAHGAEVGAAPPDAPSEAPTSSDAPPDEPSVPTKPDGPSSDEAPPEPSGQPAGQSDEPWGDVEEQPDTDAESASFEDRELHDAEEALQRSQASRKSKLPIVAGLVAGLLVLVGGGLLLTDPGEELLRDLTGSPPVEDDDPESAVDPEFVAGVEQATEEVAQAQETGVDTIEMLTDDAETERADEWIEERLDQNAWDELYGVMSGHWNNGRRDASFMATFAEVLIETDRFGDARQVLLEAIVEHPDDDWFELHQRAVRDDEQLTSYQFEELAEPANYRVERRYDQSNHQGLVLRNGDFDGQLIFKPEGVGESDWQLEVAMWRFCQLVVCHFDVFETQPAKMTRQFFDDVDEMTDEIAAFGDEFNWQTAEVDDQQTQVVVGSLEYVPESTLANFRLGGPLPWSRTWREWVTAGDGSSEEVLNRPVSENLEELRVAENVDFSADVLDALGEMKTTELSRQIATLILVDFMFNNPERIASPNHPDAGSNKPIADSTMVARHNGRAFDRVSISRRARERFELFTTRHSRSTAASIRALDEELLSRVLFPEATGGQEAIVDTIWDQRDAVLDHIDELESVHGEDEVLYFP